MFENHNIPIIDCWLLVQNRFTPGGLLHSFGPFMAPFRLYVALFSHILNFSHWSSGHRFEAWTKSRCIPHRSRNQNFTDPFWLREVFEWGGPDSYVPHRSYTQLQPHAFNLFDPGCRLILVTGSSLLVPLWMLAMSRAMALISQTSIV